MYKAFESQVAHVLLNKLAFVYTPKHGSLLDVAECEISVLSRQCFDRWILAMEAVRSEINAWTQSATTLRWQLIGGLQPKMRG